MLRKKFVSIDSFQKYLIHRHTVMVDLLGDGPVHCYITGIIPGLKKKTIVTQNRRFSCGMAFFGEKEPTTSGIQKTLKSEAMGLLCDCSRMDSPRIDIALICKRLLLKVSISLQAT